MTTKIDITGNLGRDPELKTSRNGTPVCNLRVAVTPRSKNKATNEWEDDGNTQWYSATLFGEEAEVAASTLGKGQKVRVTGSLVHRAWTGQDGTQRVDHEIRFPSVTLPLPRNAQNPAQGTGARPQWGNASPGAWEAPRNDSVGFGNENMDAPF